MFLQLLLSIINTASCFRILCEDLLRIPVGSLCGYFRRMSRVKTCRPPDISQQRLSQTNNQPAIRFNSLCYLLPRTIKFVVGACESTANRLVWRLRDTLILVQLSNLHALTRRWLADWKARLILKQFALFIIRRVWNQQDSLNSSRLPALQQES
jgi:hypothetical protein